MSEVLYRKYRPHTFEDVVGQESIVKTLKAEIELNNLAHAYIFAGSRGTGKTSIARIFAREIGTSAHDLYEIDAASHTGVDDVREITESVHTQPFDSKYKVYLFDEAHMLSKSAFNALLKTLEEPPAHVIFILATTELHKLMDTVLSRCETYSFKKPSSEILKQVVLNVVKKEKFTMSESSAELISILGDGSFRDTLGILQKILSSSESKKISDESVALVSGAPKGELINSIIESIVTKNIAGALEAIKTLKEQNVDIQVALKMLLHKLRAFLLIQFGEISLLERDFAKNELEKMKQLLEKSGSAEGKMAISSKTLTNFLDAYTETPRSQIQSLPLEIALIKSISEV